VALDVFAGDFVGKVVVENDDLYSYLKKTEGFDKVRYKSHMKAVIAGGQPMVLRTAKIEKRGIYIEGKDIPENTFGVVRQFKDVDDIVSKGCETFIRYYFLGEELESIKASAKSCAEIVNNAKEPLNYKRELLDTSKRNSIISKLFEWQIPARIEDISNDLVRVKYEIKGHL